MTCARQRERVRRDAPRRLDDEGDDARALDEERVVVVAAHFCDVALARVVIERAAVAVW